MQTGNGKVVTHVTKGLVIGAALVAYTFAGELAHFNQANWFVWARVGVFVASVAGSVMYFAYQQQGNVNFSVLLVHGLKLSAVITCLLFLYTVISVNWLFPGNLDAMVGQSLASAAKNGNTVNKDDAEAARKITSSILLSSTVMGGMLTGMLGALAGAGIAKKNPAFVQQKQS